MAPRQAPRSRPAARAGANASGRPRDAIEHELVRAWSNVS
ncbi:hypothetical protein AZ20_4195 [Bordetella bronchiseptica E014]|nr:hypothetical protein L555_2972 [Bordetella pertussis STO1-CHOC-0008]KAK52825.1 hypothetical protein L576_4398 [Bordetella bronchiseptica OSU054]KCV36213.1 hypothetical protein L489_4582 [Bordetella bronchiseptica 00-P-2730]KCV56449.1 hypothetical protein L492_4178 [Bordetella bronchiseptica 7E71]KDC20944.1 hypothetical protein L542_4278 [Bordetella bronchiseptica F-1]KDC22998.1 hypothetical protein AZ20_4195 [Bordetella bronchiseptica E014]KDC34274.1 hypothetical protein L506_4270 [Bordete